MFTAFFLTKKRFREVLSLATVLVPEILPISSGTDKKNHPVWLNTNFSWWKNFNSDWKLQYKADMHNIRPTGQIWPPEDFNLARLAQIFFFLACFLINSPFEWVKTYHFGPWVWAKKLRGLPWHLSRAPLI